MGLTSMTIGQVLNPLMKVTVVLVFLILLVCSMGIFMPTMVVPMVPQEKLGDGVLLGIYNLCVNPAKTGDANSMAGLLGAFVSAMITMDPSNGVASTADEWSCGGIEDGGNGSMRMIMCLVGLGAAAFGLKVCLKSGTRSQQKFVFLLLTIACGYIYMFPLIDTGGLSTTGMGKLAMMGAAMLSAACLVLRFVVQEAGSILMAVETESQARVQSEASDADSANSSVGKESSEASSDGA